MAKKASVSLVLLGVLLFLGTMVYAVRWVRATIDDPLIAAGAASADLAPHTVDALRRLDGRTEITAFLSPRKAMPADMKIVGDRIEALLEKIRAAAPQSIDIRVIDPDAGDRSGQMYAAQKGASPIVLRKVDKDESSQEKVWSSIVVTHDKHPDALLQGIRPRDLDRLENWIVLAIEQAMHPRAAEVAIAASPGTHQVLKDILAKFTPDQNRGIPTMRVTEVDFAREKKIPDSTDWFIWIAPEAPGAADAAAIREILDSGRSVLCLGAPFAPQAFENPDGTIGHKVRRDPADWSAFLDPFGLALTSVLVLDKNHDGIETMTRAGKAVKDDQPYHWRVSPADFDVSRFTGPNTGALLVRAAAPIEIQQDAVRRTGRTPFVVATTSESASALELPDGVIDAASFISAWPVPKQPFIVLLSADDPWRGDFVYCSTDSLVDDRILTQGGNANPLFMQTLARTYSQAARLVRVRVERPAVARIPADASRIFWRLWAVFCVPGALILLGAVRMRPRTEAGPAPVLKFAGIGLLLVLAAGIAASLVARLGASRLDLTPDRRHSPAPEAVRRTTSASGLAAELVITDSSAMPSALKDLERSIVLGLRDLGLRPAVTRPAALDAARRAELERDGVRPFAVEVVDGDREKTVSVTSALVLSRGGKRTVIPRLDPAALARFEFLVTTAAMRLDGTRPPRIAVLSDLPRVSPAEASDYQQKGYTAPVGSDVYADAKRMLAESGYELIYVAPDAVEVPANIDLFLWLQPRYALRMIPAFAKYMADGGRAIVALQHYNMLQRQHRGAGFKTVYWPQPQFHRFNDYLEHLGLRQIGEKRVAKKGTEPVEIPGEVLFDRNQSNLTLDTNVYRSAFKELDRQQVARPFIIRVNGDGLAADRLPTRNLGEVLFIWPSRFEIEPELFKKRGFAAKVSVTTSERTWGFPWMGGFVPEENFEWTGENALGKVPLVLELEGRFPRVDTVKDAEGRESLSVTDAAADAKSGRLLLIGSSEMFKNARLHTPGVANDRLLLNAVAELVWPGEVAALGARVPVTPGLPYIEAGAKAKFRALVIAMPPAALVLAGALFRLIRRRAIVRRAGR